MAAVTEDNAGCYVPAATGDTIAGTVYIDWIDWHGAAIAAGNVLTVTGLKPGVASGQTRGVIWEVTAEAADRAYSRYIGKEYYEILFTWTSSNGTVQMHTREYNTNQRREHR